MKKGSPCPECGSKSLYRGRPVATWGGHGPDLLGGLGGAFRPAKLRVVACKDCGLMRLFAEPAARERMPRAKKWERA